MDIVPADPGGDVRTLTTAPDGTASTTLLAGRYHLVTRPTYNDGRWWAWDMEIPVGASGYSVELNGTNVALLPPEEVYAQLDPAAPYIRGAKPRVAVISPQAAALQPKLPYGRFNDYLGAQPPAAPVTAAQARPTFPEPPPTTHTAAVEPPPLPQGERAATRAGSATGAVAKEYVVVEPPPLPNEAAVQAPSKPVQAAPGASSNVPVAQASTVAMAAPPMTPPGAAPASVAAGAPAISRAQAPPPIALALLIDNSEKMEHSSETVARALQQLTLSPSADTAVLYFQKRPVLQQALRNGRSKLENPAQLPPPRGGAALYDGVIAATNTLAGSSERSKAVIVISPGDDTASRASARDVVARASAVPGLAVYGIVVGDGTQSQDLQDLANQTGGVVYSAHDPAQVLLAYDTISRRVTDRSAAPAYAAATSVAPERLPSIDFRRPLALYNAIVVDPIPVAANADARDFPAGNDYILHRVLMARLRDSQLFSRVVNGGDAQARQALSDVRAVQLSGAIVKYHKGSRLRRTIIGMGTAKLAVRFVLRDLQTGQVLAVLDKEGSGSSGVLSGGDDEQQQTQALLSVVNGVMKEIQKNR